MPNLALNGGSKVVDRPIGSPWPVYDDREKQALIEVLESRKWGRSAYDYFNHEGSRLFEFEKQFAAFHDGNYALAVATGTTALEVCVRVAGVEAGCEVIVPACTYIASATAVMMCNGVPVIVDVDPRNYTIDPAAVEAAITPRTKAVMAVDFGGMPCDTDALGDICRKHGLSLISNCSHAHGGQWRGKGVGSHADLAGYSCMPMKVLAIGEGGVIMTVPRVAPGVSRGSRHRPDRADPTGRSGGDQVAQRPVSHRRDGTDTGLGGTGGRRSGHALEPLLLALQVCQRRVRRHPPGRFQEGHLRRRSALRPRPDRTDLSL